MRAPRASSSSRSITTTSRRATTPASPISGRPSALGHRADQTSGDAVPEGRADQCPARHQRAERQLVEQRAAGIVKGLEEWKAANPGREVTITKLDAGGDRATTSDRVGAYLNAHPDTTAYIETGSQDVAVAHWLKDRGIPPGKIIVGGFDVESDVLQEMKSGYIQAHADQQPYMQGFMPVMEVYLAKTVGLAPSDIDTGNGIVLADQADAITAQAAKGLR